ncbi:hypothetical protein LCGC14_1582010 [marine sediment metagenome]|uniref:Transglycosylase SLT domain-containing protein n=1 Tax=marine sediment metagenome TaxID=412755 RepID=A0A0F9LGT6_9ZZZZ
MKPFKGKRNRKLKIKNNYNTTLTFLIVIHILVLTISFGIYTRRNNPYLNIIFSFKTIEIDSDIGLISISFLEKEFSDEYETIMAAAYRNGCEGDNLLILFAIRKAENGPPGNEFGIMCQKGTSLDTQAGWAAVTIIKSWKKWNGEGDFIICLGDKYCPSSVDYVGNINWIKNVTYWYEKFKEKENK